MGPSARQLLSSALLPHSTASTAAMCSTTTVAFQAPIQAAAGKECSWYMRLHG